MARPWLVVSVPRSVCGFSWDRIPWSEDKGEAPCTPLWAAFSASRLGGQLDLHTTVPPAQVFTRTAGPEGLLH